MRPQRDTGGAVLSFHATGGWCRQRRLAVVVAVARLVAALVLVAVVAAPMLTHAAESTHEQAGNPGPSREPLAAKPRPEGGGTRAKRPGAPGNLVGHGGPVKAVAVDQATHRALTGSFDYAMILWDISQERPRILHRFAEHEGAVNAVAFVPGSDHAVAAGDDGSIWLWDLGTGKLVHRFEGHRAKVNWLAVSSDGRYAASASWDRTARIWDLAGRAAGPVLSGHAGPVNAAAFSADGATVYTAGYDGMISSWSREDGSLRRAGVLKNGWGVNVLVRLPGSELLLFGTLNGRAAILDPANGEITTELPMSPRPILAAAAIDKPGLFATGGGDGTIRVVRAGDGAVIEEYTDPFGPVWALAFADHGAALYFGGLDDFAVRWQVSPRAPFEPPQGLHPRRFQPDESASPGERQFARKCSVCHTLEVDGANRAGPTLHGVFGRKAGTVAGYPYSPALREARIVWNEETIARLFELGPENFTPGSKMPLQKITDPEIRNELIAFLKRATGDDREPASKEPSRQ